MMGYKGKIIWLVLFAMTLTGDRELQAQPKSVVPNQSINPGEQVKKRSDDDIVPNLIFPNAEMKDILLMYEKLTGKQLIWDVTVLGGQKLYIVSNKEKKLTRREAIEIIQASLILNDYSLVPVEGTDLVKVLRGKPPLGEGIPLYVDADQLPTGHEIVSYLMRLENINVDSAMEIFQQVFQTQGPYVAMTAVPDSGAIIISNKANIILKMLELQKNIDVPPTRLQREWVRLERADAERVTEFINGIIEGRQEAAANTTRRTTAPRQRTTRSPKTPTRPNQPRSSTTGNVGTTEIGEDVQLHPDVRTNRILVITPSKNSMEQVVALIKELDSEVDLQKPYEKKLNFIQVIDVISVLQEILAEGDDQGGAGGNLRSRQQSRLNPQQNNNNPSNQDRGFSSQLSDPNVQNAPEAVSIGKVRLIANNRSNSLLVMGPPESITKISDILDLLDKREPQVFLNTVIGNFNVGDDSSYSIDFFKTYDDHIGSNGFAGKTSNNFRQNNPFADTRPDPRALLETAALSATGVGSGLSLFGAVGTVLDVYLNALASSNRFEIISRPSVTVQNNQKATFKSGEQIPVAASTLSDVGTNGTFQSNIEFKDVELILEVIPLINSDDEITLQISQQNDTAGDVITVNGQETPRISTQSIVSTITIPNNSTVVLGGLVTKRKNNNESGTPFLKDIPLIGALFKNKSIQDQRSELVVLIEPTILNTAKDLIDNTTRELGRSVIREAFEKSGILRNSNERFQTSKANQPKQPEATDIQIRKAEPVTSGEKSEALSREEQIIREMQQRSLEQISSENNRQGSL